MDRVIVVDERPRLIACTEERDQHLQIGPESGERDSVHPIGETRLVDAERHLTLEVVDRSGRCSDLIDPGWRRA